MLALLDALEAAEADAALARNLREIGRVAEETLERLRSHLMDLPV